jgi:hypothetical protein
MPRIRLDMDQQTYHALIEHTVNERRPIPWQAEMIIRRSLSTDPSEPVSPILEPCFSTAPKKIESVSNGIAKTRAS